MSLTLLLLVVVLLQLLLVLLLLLLTVLLLRIPLPMKLYLLLLLLKGADVTVEVRLLLLLLLVPCTTSAVRDERGQRTTIVSMIFVCRIRRHDSGLLRVPQLFQSADGETFCTKQPYTCLKAFPLSVNV